MSDLEQALGLAQTTTSTTRLKCMGRTYGAVAAEGTVSISDITDITRPVQLGTARADHDGGWEVHNARGHRLDCARDLLHAVAVLRQAIWPTRDPR
jgi:hypothetical protein